ncbi:LYR motif-containing protein 4 [Belonocnema kinseyi]|uniref:LYR motif-containing protein 4 n=1 Tax=Belonocnema kinseyi TaxID=2817044 RepID=UPI00143D5D22|nr:LYR motif-containing protein 4 [Belonocnema kinseyi]
MGLGREAVLKLYGDLIRESRKWHSYNYRTFALRKIRHEFQENKSVTDQSTLKESFVHGQEALELIKRQVVIGNLYSTRPLIIETQSHEEKCVAKAD